MLSNYRRVAKLFSYSSAKNTWLPKICKQIKDDGKRLSPKVFGVWEKEYSTENNTPSIEKAIPVAISVEELLKNEHVDDFEPSVTLINTSGLQTGKTLDIDDIFADDEVGMMQLFGNCGNSQILENAAPKQELLNIKSGMENFSKFCTEDDFVGYAAIEDWESAVASNAEDLPQCNLTNLMAQEADAPEEDNEDIETRFNQILGQKTPPKLIIPPTGIITPTASMRKPFAVTKRPPPKLPVKRIREHTFFGKLPSSHAAL